MTKIFLAVLLMLSTLAGCSTGPVVQTMEVTKVTAESILYEARVAQGKGKITTGQFDVIRGAYDKLKVAVDLSIDARIGYLTLQTPDAEVRMTGTIAAVTDATVQLISLASSLGLISATVGGAQ